MVRAALATTLQVLLLIHPATSFQLSRRSAPSTTLVGRLGSTQSPVSDSLLGIAVGDEFNVRVPEDFTTKKVQRKRRRSQSPLLVQVFLENEDDVFGPDTSVTTMLRLGRDMEPHDLFSGQKLRAFVAEVKSVSKNGAAADDTNEGSGGSVLILSTSRAYAIGKGYDDGSADKVSSKRAADKVAHRHRGLGGQVQSMVPLASLSAGDRLQGRVVGVGPDLGGIFVNCGVSRPGKGGAAANVDGFLAYADIDSHHFSPSSPSSSSSSSSLPPLDRGAAPRQAVLHPGDVAEFERCFGADAASKPIEQLDLWPGFQANDDDDGDGGAEVLAALKATYPNGVVACFDAAHEELTGRPASAATSAAESAANAAAAAAGGALDEGFLPLSDFVEWLARKFPGVTFDLPATLGLLHFKKCSVGARATNYQCGPRWQARRFLARLSKSSRGVAVPEATSLSEQSPDGDDAAATDHAKVAEGISQAVGGSEEEESSSSSSSSSSQKKKKEQKKLVKPLVLRRGAVVDVVVKSAHKQSGRLSLTLDPSWGPGSAKQAKARREGGRQLARRQAADDEKRDDDAATSAAAAAEGDVLKGVVTGRVDGEGRTVVALGPSLVASLVTAGGGSASSLVEGALVDVKVVKSLSSSLSVEVALVEEAAAMAAAASAALEEAASSKVPAAASEGNAEFEALLNEKRFSAVLQKDEEETSTAAVGLAEEGEEEEEEDAPMTIDDL